MLFLFGILSWYISLLHQAFIVFQAVEPPCLDALSVGVLRAPQSPLSTVSDLVDIGVGTKGLLNESTFFVDLSEFGIGAKAGHADWIDVGVAPLCASLPSFSPVLDLQNVGWYDNPFSQAPGPLARSIQEGKPSTARTEFSMPLGPIQKPFPEKRKTAMPVGPIQNPFPKKRRLRPTKKKTCSVARTASIWPWALLAPARPYMSTQSSHTFLFFGVLVPGALQKIKTSTPTKKLFRGFTVSGHV